MFRKKILPWIVWLLYNAWTATWRTSHHEPPFLQGLMKTGKPWVAALWHGDELALVHFCTRYKVATMTSTSKDGELMTFVLNKFGMATSRGSSTRGGVSALKGMIRLARQGYSPVVAVDGPKGPLHKAKPGVFELARVLGLPIVPVGVFASHKYVFEKSWNKAFLPLPFSRVAIVWDEPLSFPEDADPRDPQIAHTLEQRLDALGRRAAKLFAKV